MIEKASFIKIMDTLDAYFNGDILKAFDLLGIGENEINKHMDIIIDSIDKDVDPKQLARHDDFTADCGSFVCEWLFGVSDLQERCKTAGELYDYIVEKYVTFAKENSKT